MQRDAGWVPIDGVVELLGGAVHRSTVIRWIAAERIRGRRVLGVWYVEVASVPELAAREDGRA